MRSKRYKAFFTGFLAFLYIISINIPICEAAAAGGESGPSRVKGVRYSASAGVETVTINLDSYGEVGSFYLNEPRRFVFDIKGAVLPSGQHSMEVGAGSVLRVRYSNFDAQTVRFVVDLAQNASFIIKTGKGFVKAEASSGAPDAGPIMTIPLFTAGGQAQTSGQYDVIGQAVPAVQSGTQGQTGAQGQNKAQEQSGTQGQANVNAQGQAGATEKTDAAGQANAQGQAGTQGQTGTQGDAKTPAASGAAAGDRPVRTPRPSRVRSPAPPAVRRASPKRSPAAPIITEEPPQDDLTQPPTILTKEEIRLDVAPDLAVIFSTKNGNTLRIITPKGAAGKAVISESKEQPRISVDIPYASADGLPAAKKMQVNADVLNYVSVSRPERNTARVTIAIRNKVGVKYTKNDGDLTFTLTNQLIPNVGYHCVDERVFITLYKTALTTGSEQQNKFYESVASDNGQTWTLSFNNEYSSLVTGGADVKGVLVKSIETRKEASKTKVIIKAKDKVRLVIHTKYMQDINLLETTVSVVRPAAASERVVVIDAGHGGFAPGAVAMSGKPEKDFNLDIAIKLKERLAQENGLRVFMTRDGDYYVDLYERAQLANEIGAALFVSIHANASGDNPDASGVETLYYPAETESAAFSSRIFAEMTQKNLINRLKATDRGIKERPNLVVLRWTNMPAILVETAFVTNSDDIVNLSRSAYRKNVAKSIADSVIKALAMI